MNLKILATNVMLLLSRAWLNEPLVRGLLERHPLGAAILLEIRRAHDRLSLQDENRRKLAIALARITALIGDLDGLHDSKGRALYTGLTSLAEGVGDPELARLYLGIRDLLFPEGLAILARSYAYEAGAIEALQQRVTPEVIAQLESVPMGTQTLADWYRGLVDAGNELGVLLGQRASLLARTTRGGTGVVNLDLRAARGQWIHAVHTLLSTIRIMELSREEREIVLGHLDLAVRQATSNRGGGSDEPGDDEPGDGEPIDGEPGDDEPIDDEPSAEELAVNELIAALTSSDDVAIAPSADALAIPAGDDNEPPASA